MNKLAEYETLLTMLLTGDLSGNQYPQLYMRLRASDRGYMLGDLSVYSKEELDLLADLFTYAENYCGDGDVPDEKWEIGRAEFFEKSREHLIRLRKILSPTKDNLDEFNKLLKKYKMTPEETEKMNRAYRERIKELDYLFKKKSD